MKHSDMFLGVLLTALLVVTLIFANTPWGTIYLQLIHQPLGFHFSFISFINDVLMSLFFLLIALEIKHSIHNGPLRNLRQAFLPCFAAIGGMVVPALIYCFINRHNAHALQGWAIPMATDIAFALGFLGLFQKSISSELRDFLLVLAVVDDIGAILVIAIFYTNHLAMLPFIGMLVCLFVLWLCNKKNITTLWIYIFLGIMLWLFVFQCGIHATLAGVLLAFFIPVKKSESLEHKLKPWVNFLVLPLFVVTNAAISFTSVSLQTILHPISLGIILGLFFGKQLGVFFTSYFAIKCKIAHLPKDSSWTALYGVCLLTGIGFTMSLFIGNLSFTDPVLIEVTKIGVLLGSLLSAMIGISVLAFI
jgi:NhaA family Na+:H+ antiporter